MRPKGRFETFTFFRKHILGKRQEKIGNALGKKAVAAMPDPDEIRMYFHTITSLVPKDNCSKSAGPMNVAS